MSSEAAQRQKVAIVCDWLAGTGGAERVVLELHRMFPEAPIYTSQYISDSRIWHGSEWFKQADIRTTWLQNLPKGLKKFLPLLRVWAFSRLDLSDYDLVLISSGAEAKGVKTGKAKSIWYCHAPTHYYWSRYEQYIANPGFGVLDPIARLGLKVLVSPLRRWDYKAAQKPDQIIANSTHTKNEIKKYYGRVSQVIFPPVDLDRFIINSTHKRSGYVTAGRQVPYKRIDLAVEACKIMDLPLTVVGNGPEHKKLVSLAGKKTRFITDASDQQVADIFASSEGFIFPTLTEDFGITPLEAMATGTPVVAYKNGGPVDYIKPENGVFFEKHTTDSLIAAIKKLKNNNYNPQKVSDSVKYFSSQRFQKEFINIIY